MGAVLQQAGPQRAGGKVLPAPVTPSDLPFGATFLKLTTPVTARRFLGPRDDLERQRRSAVWNSTDAYRIRGKLHLGMHDRMEEYMLADGRIHGVDAAGHARAFPLHLKSVRLDVLRLGAGECVDLTCKAADWPELPPGEERYLRVSIDRLEVGPGACLTWSGNVACIWIDQIVGRDGLLDENPFVISIRGTEHFAHSQVRKCPPLKGTDGAPGRNGLPGESRLKKSFLGASFDPALPAGAEHGQTGMAGSPGGEGAAGRNGGLLMVAGIEIGELSGIGRYGLRVDVQAGSGEIGGDGGAGGAGGHGGTGSPGWWHPDGLPTAGRGGRGGDGGAGGPGGDGGRGGLASHVFVTVPSGQTDRVRIAAKAGPGGAGGVGGAGGCAGLGGSSGKSATSPFATSEPDAPDGAPGACGPNGRPGRNGRSGPEPSVWLFERPIRRL